MGRMGRMRQIGLVAVGMLTGIGLFARTGVDTDGTQVWLSGTLNMGTNTVIFGGEPRTNWPDYLTLPLSGPNIVPVGSMIFWHTNIAPAGWFICDGSGRHTVTHSNLFAEIGYNFGGSGTNFLLPNMVQRFPMGGVNNVGTTGGASTITLVSNNIPAHVHSVNPPATASGNQSASHYHAVDPPSTASGGQSATHYHPADSSVLYYLGYVNSGGSAGLAAGANVKAFGKSAAADANHTHSTDIASFNSGNNVGDHTHTTDIGSFASGASGAGSAFASLPPYMILPMIIKY
jgi:microcystin-dependent protein